MAGGDGSPATAAEQTPNVYAPGVAVNVRASSTPKPSCPARVTVNVQPDPGVPSADVGTVIVTSPGVSLPDGDSWATETWGVPTVDDPEMPEVDVAGVTQSSVPNPSTSMSWFHALAGAIEELKGPAAPGGWVFPAGA